MDYFSGHIYKGGRIINEYDAPFWKLPVFVKRGAIIPMVNPNNNVSQIDNTQRIFELYPYGESDYSLYDDDGKTELYRLGEHASTHIHSSLQKNRLTIHIDKTEGSFQGQQKNQATELRINLSQMPKKLTAKMGGKSVKLTQVNSLDELNKTENSWFYDEAPQLNRFATKGCVFEKKDIHKNPMVYVRLAKNDITANDVELRMDGYQMDDADVMLHSTGALAAPQASMKENKNANKAFTLTAAWNAQTNADYYEMKVDGMIHSTIRGTEFTVENLKPETDYEVQVRAVNKDGVSDWTTLQAHTIKDPLDEAIHDITATNSIEDWGGLDVSKMFDFNEKNFWHTNYYKKGVLPFDVTLNLNGIAKLDKIHYVPASERETNGQIQKGKFAISNDGINWTETGSFDWKNEDAVKEYQFKGNPEAQYIKMTVEEARGGQGSGTEMYVFKMPGSKMEKAGDINHDGRIDENDFTSYLNYFGLRKGDKDFEGYVSKGDINGNGHIDAYDISVVATQLKSGVSSKQVPAISGSISLIADKKVYKAGETITLTIKGKNLVSLNALSFALPYSASEYEFIGVDVKDMGKMENITKDRLHSDGSKVLYPSFVNMGEQPAVEGTHDLFTIKLKAKKACKPAFKLNQLMMVDKFLRVKSEK